MRNPSLPLEGSGCAPRSPFNPAERVQPNSDKSSRAAELSKLPISSADIASWKNVYYFCTQKVGVIAFLFYLCGDFSNGRITYLPELERRSGPRANTTGIHTG